MSLCLANLLDVEKYLLLELTYFHLPPEEKHTIKPEQPMPLDILIDLVDRCHYSIFPVFLNRTPWGRRFARARQGYFRRVYAASDNLGDVQVTGYLNDNYGKFGNTPDKFKTSLVCLSFADSQGNGIVSFSGCEQMQLSNLLLDWGGCVISYFGYVTIHHQRALAFFDQQMATISGERGVLGHSKGGNLATYIYINRLKEKISAYCVNAQPYCWFAMNDQQRQALKSESFEYIVHANDPTKKAGYVSYVSRTAPLNRYVSQGNIFNVHGLTEAEFDEFGNLHGARVIRQTRGGLKSRLFRDYASEKRLSHDELMVRFTQRLEQCSSMPRLLSAALDELLLVTEAEAAIAWFKDRDTQGEFIYPFIIKSPRAEELCQLKLRAGQGPPARCAFTGLPLYIHDPAQYQLEEFGLDQAMGLMITSEIDVPLGHDEDAVFGVLQVVNKAGGVFSVEDFALVSEMTLAMQDYYQGLDSTPGIPADFALLRLRQGKEKLLAVERHAFHYHNCADAAKKEALLAMLWQGKLPPDGVLLFNRRKFTPRKMAELKTLRQRDLFLLSLAHPERKLGKTLREALLTWQVQPGSGEGQLLELLELFGLSDKKNTPLKHLNDQEFISYLLALARVRQPMLVLVDLPGGAVPQLWEEPLAQLKEACRGKRTTVLVLGIGDENEAKAATEN